MLRQGRITAVKKDLSKHWFDYVLDSRDGWSALEGALNLSRPIILEIGFGMGVSLHNQAQSDRQTSFIGIDVYLPGIGNLIGLLEKNRLENVRLYCEDAVEVIQRVIKANPYIRYNFFPDPWPKKKHFKRRLIN